MSLLRFMNDVNLSPNGRGQLYFGRADVDGAPFRGIAPPVGTEEELEERLVRTNDAHNRIFNLSVPEDNKAYVELLTLMANGAAQCLHREIIRSHRKVRQKTMVDGQPTITVSTETNIKVYMEWLIPYMEDKAQLRP